MGCSYFSIMETQNFNKKIVSTNDHIIRTELRKVLEKDLEQYKSKTGSPANLFEELGVSHGHARIDFAFVNGIMHGYEIKSDRDTLSRLFGQMQEYNAVFDKVTLVVGQRYLLDAMHHIPEWWGVVLAKTNKQGKLVFYSIREAKNNENEQVPVSIARMLWREEALRILEDRNEADGIRSKPREIIYQKLADTLKDDINALKKHVNLTLTSRAERQSVVPLMSSGG